MAVLTNIIVDGVNYLISDANAVPLTRTINNKTLEGDIVLDYSDVGIVPMTDEEIDKIVEA